MLEAKRKVAQLEELLWLQTEYILFLTLFFGY
jgi:hypothetical protein